MALKDELETQGNFLFRWRSYIPGFILLMCFLQFSNYTYYKDDYYLQLYYTIFCFFISFLGLVVRCWTIAYVPQMTSGRNTKKQVADSLNQNGIYSIVRHPLYIGNFLMFLGVVVYFRDVLLIISFILFFCFYYERIMYAEEAFLTRKFGEAYHSWSSNVPAVIPRFHLYKRADLSFSFKNILKREYPSYFGLVFTYTLFDLLTLFYNSSSTNKIFAELINEIHIIFFGSGLLLYIIIRFIVKKTNLLNVENR